MDSRAPSRGDPHLLRLAAGTSLGAVLVATGLGLAFLVLGTPLVSRLVPPGGVGSSQPPTAMLVWSLALFAGTALLVAGTDRLAVEIASVRSRSVRLSAIARAMTALPDDVVLLTGVALEGGRPIPEMLIGPFGVAAIHELHAGDRRRVGRSWESRSKDGWLPAEDPLELVARDADRMRHWLTNGDLDFVVRVHAALVTPDASISRSPLCAVITADQIPAWIEALPRQRSLSPGRRDHLVARVRETVVDKRPRRGRQRFDRGKVQEA